MYYFFVGIKYYHNNNLITFSTVIECEEYPTKIEIIEEAFVADSKNHMYLGYSKLYDTVHDKTTDITSYSQLTKQQYERYKYINPLEINNL